MKRTIYIWLVLIYLLTVGIHFLGVFQAVEDWAIIHRFSVKGLLTKQALESDIVIIGIDDKSLSQIGTWPWSRDVHTQLIQMLAKESPKIVGLNLIFDQRTELETDAAFAEAIKQMRVVLPVTLDLKISRGLLGEEIKVNQTITPLSMFDEIAWTGHVQLIPDADGVVRRSFPILGETPSFALSLARRYRPQVHYPKHQFWIDYIGPPRSYSTYSYVDILNGYFPQGTFTGKIVLVGVLEPALGDQFVTPYAQFGLMSGVEIHANQLQTLLMGGHLQRIHPIYFILLLAGLAILSGWTIFTGKPAFQLGGTFFLILTYYLWTHYLFIYKNFILPYSPILIMFSFNLFLGILVSYVKSDAERNKWSKTFQRYLAPQVLDQVLAKPDDLGLGGARKMAAVLFIDIRGFTAFTHHHQPEEVVVLLNRYLELFADVIFAFEGTLDKYLGDGLMAVFGAPVEGKNDLERAFGAALEIRARVKQEELPMPLGMGLAYGSVISGNIGSDKRMDFTVIGDVVNTASRLEGIAGPGELVVTEEVACLLEMKQEGKKEVVTIKGIQGLMTIYRL